MISRTHKHWGLVLGQGGCNEACNEPPIEHPMIHRFPPSKSPMNRHLTLKKNLIPCSLDHFSGSLGDLDGEKLWFIGWFVGWFTGAAAGKLLGAAAGMENFVGAKLTAICLGSGSPRVVQ